MYKNGKFSPQIKYVSKSYVVLCYAKTKKGWFTQEDYKAFQLNRTAYTKDISRNFETLSRFGYLAKHKTTKQTQYRITADGDTCLRTLGQQRLEDYADKLRETGNLGNISRLRNNQINLNETPLTSN